MVEIAQRTTGYFPLKEKKEVKNKFLRYHFKPNLL